MGDYALNTVKGHGFAVGDTVTFYGMANDDFPPAEEPTLCILTKQGTKYVLTYTGEHGQHEWTFGPSAKIWAGKVEDAVTVESHTLDNGDTVWTGHCEHGWTTGFHISKEDAYAVAGGHGKVSRPLYVQDKAPTVESGCRSLNHVYCVGPCPIRDRNRADDSAAHTHVETEAQCLARIAREDFRVGDAYTFRNMTGYRLYQDRPFACRGLECQCGKACHGTVVESPEILTDVAHYVSGGLEIQGSKGSRAVIRPDRLD